MYWLWHSRCFERRPFNSISALDRILIVRFAPQSYTECMYGCAAAVRPNSTTQTGKGLPVCQADLCKRLRRTAPYISAQGKAPQIVLHRIKRTITENDRLSQLLKDKAAGHVITIFAKSHCYTPTPIRRTLKRPLIRMRAKRRAQTTE